MIDPDLIIPLPPGSVSEAIKDGQTKQVVGLYPCFGGCKQYALVKLDNSGKPYMACTPHEVTHLGGCGRTYGEKRHIPEQTRERYQDRLEFLSKHQPVPDAYKRYLENAWGPEEPEEGEANECGAEASGE